MTFFTEILKVLRGNGSSESTRFPVGLVLGNWVKIFHPRNFGDVRTPANSQKRAGKGLSEDSISAISKKFTNLPLFGKTIVEWA
jgi:hypothetical protein